MQQTKRRSKKGVILLALAIALLVMAFVPAAQAATLKSALTIDTPASVVGQGGILWVGAGPVTGEFNALLDASDNGNYVLTTDVSQFVYWINGAPLFLDSAAHFVPFAGNPTGPVTFVLAQGVNTITHTADTTQTVATPPQPFEPKTDTVVGVDTVGPVWSWTLSPPDPGGDLTSPDDAGWYGNVPVTFTATASDPGGSGVATASAIWTNITTTTPSAAFGVSPLGGNPFTKVVTGIVTPPSVDTTPQPSAIVEHVDATTVALSATDMVGNHGTDSFRIRFDVWPPVTTYDVSPVGADTFGGYTNKDVTVKFIAADALAGVAYTEYIVVDTATSTTPPPTPALTATGTHGTTVTITKNAPVGPVWVFYRSVDKAVPANLEQWHLLPIFIDKTAPDVSPAEGFPTWWINHGDEMRDNNLTVGKGDYNGHEFFDVFLTATDFNSGLAMIEFSMPTWIPPFDDVWNIYDGSIELFVDRAGHATDGIFPLSYRATDNVGNISETTSTVVKIDTRAPVTDGASDWVNGTVPYVLTATDQVTGAGVAATIYRVDQSTPWLINEASPTAAVPTLTTSITLTGGQGATHTIDFGSVDAALPADYDASATVGVPPVPLWPGPSYTYGNLEGVSWQWSEHSQGFEAFSGYKTRSVKLDVTAPVVTAMDPKNGDWQKGPATVNFSGTDVGSGYAYTEWSTDGGTTWKKGEVAQIGGNGSITVTYHGVDKVGIKSADQTIVVNVATTQPSVTALNASVKKGHKAAFRFTVTSVTPKAEVIIQIRTKSGRTLSSHHYNNVTTGSQMSRSFMIKLKKGKYNIRISAVDQAGNTQSHRGTAWLTVK